MFADLEFCVSNYRLAKCLINKDISADLKFGYLNKNDGIKMGNIKQSNGWRQTRDPCIEFKTQPEIAQRIEFKPHHRTEMA